MLYFGGGTLNKGRRKDWAHVQLMIKEGYSIRIIAETLRISSEEVETLAFMKKPEGLFRQTIRSIFGSDGGRDS